MLLTSDLYLPSYFRLIAAVLPAGVLIFPAAAIVFVMFVFPVPATVMVVRFLPTAALVVMMVVMATAPTHFWFFRFRLFRWAQFFC